MVWGYRCHVRSICKAAAELLVHFQVAGWGRLSVWMQARGPPRSGSSLAVGEIGRPHLSSPVRSLCSTTPPCYAGAATKLRDGYLGAKTMLGGDIIVVSW